MVGAWDGPKERRTCPYCGFAECEADWVDVEVGMVQCSPFYCTECGACEIGPENHELTLKEEQTHWYEPGRAFLTCAPTIGGTPVDHRTAKWLYDRGLLDKKDE